MNPLDLQGRVALVTGASRGIGLAIAARLAGAGAQVVMTARRVDEAALGAVAAVGGSAPTAIEGDIGEADFARSLAKQVFSAHKRLDILVNNAGVMRAGMLGMTPDADIEETMRVNLLGAIHLTQAVARLMVRTGGSIVNISSIIGVRGQAGQVAYAAAKAGLIGATLGAAKELAPKNVRVNAVAPGFIETEMTAALGDAVRAETLARVGLDLAGTPEDVADVVVFLASDLSRYVTGQVIGVDGGMVI